MALENQNDGNPNPTGAEGQSTPPASGAAGQPLPDYVQQLQAQIADLSKKVSGVQKGTDKQIGQVRENLSRILELKDQGLDERQIKQQLWLDEQMDKDTATPRTPDKSQPESTLDVNAVVAKLGFQPNDPALAALQIKYASNPQAYIEAAADLRIAQVKSPAPTPGTALSPQGAVNQGDLQTEFNKQRDAIVQGKRGDEKIRALADLKITYREKGLTTV